MAGRQHGMVARRQLLALGFNAREIEHRVARGRLHLVMRGVYAVGWPTLTRQRRWMAAVLACGDGAVLSHRSAAALWEIGGEKRGVIDVSVTRRAELRRTRPARSRAPLPLHHGHRDAGMASRSRVQLRPSSISRPNCPSAQVERTVNEADKRGFVDPETLRVELDIRAGEPGAPLLRPPARQAHLSPLRLGPRDLFRPIAMAAGLPRAAHQTDGQRLRGRLLLARAWAGGRDRRPALPPHALDPGARRTAVTAPTRSPG